MKTSVAPEFRLSHVALGFCSDVGRTLHWKKLAVFNDLKISEAQGNNLETFVDQTPM